MTGWRGRKSSKFKLNEICPFPEKLPLFPVLPVQLKEGYRIEKMFEATPGFMLPVYIYSQRGLKKGPGNTECYGHNRKHSGPLYSGLNIILSRRRSFCHRPARTRWHVQYYDPEKASSIGYSVIEHIYFGNQCFFPVFPVLSILYGWDQAMIIPDRNDVDPERMDLQDFPGEGPLLHTYLRCERVKVSVPCSGHSNKRLWNKLIRMGSLFLSWIIKE